MKANQAGEYKLQLIRCDWYRWASVYISLRLYPLGNEETEAIFYQVIVIRIYFTGGRQALNATTLNKQLTQYSPWMALNKTLLESI